MPPVPVEWASGLPKGRVPSPRDRASSRMGATGLRRASEIRGVKLFLPQIVAGLDAKCAWCPVTHPSLAWHLQYGEKFAPWHVHRAVLVIRTHKDLSTRESDGSDGWRGS